MDGIIYILRIVPRFWHAQYYVGWCKTNGLWNRLKQHRTGKGAHITKAAVSQGHRLELVAEFPGTRDDERRIKNRKNTPAFVRQLERRGLLNTQRQELGARKCDITQPLRNPLPSPTELTYYNDYEDENDMTIDLSHVDLATLIEKDTGQRLKQESKCKTGSCPFCADGKDRFVVYPVKWWCRRCNKSGDAINYLMYRRGVSFSEACKELGVSLASNLPNSRTVNRPMVSDNQPTNNIRIAPERESAAFDDPAWMPAAKAFTEECFNRMMSPAGAAARDYLLQRGLSLHTIEDMRLGVNHKDRTVQWGATKVFAPAGIVFPWDDERDGLRRVNFRCDHGPHKYRLADGSAQALYLGDRIQQGARVILCEGEIDALTIWQAYERDPMLCPVATGSVTHGRVVRLISRLSLAKSIKVSFDNDEAGAAAMRWWASVSSKFSILGTPLPHKDVNALYLAAMQDPENDGKPSLARAIVRGWIEGIDQ